MNISLVVRDLLYRLGPTEVLPEDGNGIESRNVLLNINRMMDNVQKHNMFIDVSS
jgi:hypothetical protein